MSQAIHIPSLAGQILLGYTPTASEIAGLRHHLSTCGFLQRQKALEYAVEQVVPTGTPNPTNSLEAHRLKRVYHTQQWAPHTSALEYLRDIRVVFADSATELVVYGSPANMFIAGLGPNQVPSHRQGGIRGNLMYTVYSVPNDALLSGYQVNSRSEIKVGGNAIWL